MSALTEAIAQALDRMPAVLGDSRGIEAVERAFEHLLSESEGRLLPSIYRQQGDRLWLVSIMGYSGIFDGITAHRGVMAQAARTGQVQLVRDTASEPGFLAAQPGIVFEIAIPMGDYVVNFEATESLDETLMDAFENLAHLLVERLSAEPAGMTPARALSPMVSMRSVDEICDYVCRLTASLLDLHVCQVVLDSGEGKVATSWLAQDSEVMPLAAETVLDLAAEKQAYASWIGPMPGDLEQWGAPEEVILVPFSSGTLLGGLIGARSASSPGLYEADTLAAISTQVVACIERIQLEGRLNAALAARAEFMAAVSHELRTPLTAILGYSELLLGEAALSPDEAREFTCQIRDGADHLLALVTDLLDTAKAEAGQLRVGQGQAVSLRQIAREVATNLEPTARSSGCELRVDIETDVVLSGDPVRVRQIVINLVSNAIKFSQGGTVRLLAEEKGSDAVLEVVDNGVGIEPEELATLFRPFSGKSVRDPRIGTGLGLVISRHLAHAMGGSLELTSQGTGQGATARLVLPLWKPDVSSAGERTPSRGP